LTDKTKQESCVTIEYLPEEIASTLIEILPELQEVLKSRVKEPLLGTSDSVI